MTIFDSELQSLFEEERDPLFRFLFRLTRHASDAEDLLQETFLTVWRKREQFEGRGSPQAYLRRTAYRLFLNARERRLRRTALAPTISDEGAEAVERFRGTPYAGDLEETLRRYTGEGRFPDLAPDSPDLRTS